MSLYKNQCLKYKMTNSRSINLNLVRTLTHNQACQSNVFGIALANHDQELQP